MIFSKISNLIYLKILQDGFNKMKHKQKVYNKIVIPKLNNSNSKSSYNSNNPNKNSLMRNTLLSLSEEVYIIIIIIIVK